MLEKQEKTTKAIALNTKTENGGQQLIDVHAVAVKLSVSWRTVLRHADAGLIPAGHKIGGGRRWSVAEIDRFIAGGCKRIATQADHFSLPELKAFPVQSLLDTNKSETTDEPRPSEGNSGPESISPTPFEEYGSLKQACAGLWDCNPLRIKVLVSEGRIRVRQVPGSRPQYCLTDIEKIAKKASKNNR